MSVVFQLIVISTTLALVESQASNDTSNHRIEWKANQNESDFLRILQKSTDRDSFYYLFTGDTQYWIGCTPENVQCWTATSNCNADTELCQKQQGDHANRLQGISLRALISQMAQRNKRPRALVINGDLTNFGYEEQLDRYIKDWEGPLEGVKVYPGLGNHDYSNNIKQSPKQCKDCAVRMLKYYTKFVQDTLRRPISVSKEQHARGHTTYRGSLAYSWDECMNEMNGSATANRSSGNCIHFVQLNYHPGYETSISSSLDEWIVESSFDWLERDLDSSSKQYPFVINLHDFDQAFSDQNKQRLIRILSKPSYRTLAVLFAHFHNKVGPHPSGSWCINGRPVPLLYTGSVPGNNYIMMRFDPDKISSTYIFHVESETKTSVTDIPNLNGC